jgi:predicted permease
MRVLLSRILAWFGRHQADKELSEEISAHLDFATADHVARGMSPDEARRAARLSFGGDLQTKEACRDHQGWPFLEHLIEDCRQAIRVLAKRPMLLVTTTVSLGLGVGINVAVYSLLRTILFEPGLTAAAPGDLFRIDPGLSYPNYVDVRTHDAFASLAAMQASTLTYRTSDATATIGARVVSDNFFEVLGLHALYGRTFGSADGAGRVRDSNLVVISYGFWQRLGGDQTVVGRTIYLNGWPYHVTGVLPKGVYSTIGPLVSPSVYVPLGPRVNRGLDARNAAQFDIVGRLRPGMTRAQASAALAVVAHDLERRFPDVNSGLRRTLSVAPLQNLLAQIEGRSGAGVALTLVGALLAIVGLVLLVACANVTGLLLARTAERTREISIRIALGATRGRILQQFLAESAVVAVLGCGAGAALWMMVITILPKTTLVANSGIDLIPTPLSLPQCGFLVAIIGLACGIGPALAARQITPRVGLQPSQSGIRLDRLRVRQLLVVGQVGVSFILLVGGCALLLSLVRQEFANPGFDISHTLSVQMRRPTTSNGPDFFALRDAIGALPGVESVTSGDLPMGLVGFDRVHEVGAAEGAGFPVQVNRVGPRYLDTLGIHVLRGRDLRDDDVRDTRGSALPVVVGETFARRYLGSVDVINQQLVFPRDPENGRDARRLVIVGVSQDGAVQVFGGDRVPVLYVPALSSSLVVHVAGSAAGAVRAMVHTVSTLEPGAAVTVAPMADRLSGVLLPVRVATVVLGALGGVGLLLAMTGLYGVVSYAATRRRFEMGLRIALGASPSRIMQLMLREAVVIVGLGSMAGAVLSFVMIRAIWPLLAGNQSSLTPPALLAVFLLMLTIGIAAALRPAVRVAAVDPMLVLRQD